MANKINLTLKVNDDGSLDITAKKAKKAAQETEKLGRATNKAAEARNRYNKGEKGVAQAGMNSTKAFSKMRSEMGGGSSGLVGAYATLAANVFAATAAFGALQRAAEFDQLTASVEFFGNAAGRNLELVVDQLIEVTDGALSAEEAFRGTALAISSGFNTDQLVKLTEVAKGASVALGRDLGDAFDRLVRGAAKLEPEILDELGIMVRLDDAVQQYATELGKSANELTSFEKRQAFLNATIKAGEAQFADLAGEVPVNPFNQLAAAFSNLTKSGIGLLNTFLIPVANFFSSSQTALAGGVVLFASTISRQMLPALSEGASKLRDISQASRDNGLANLEMLDAVSKNDTRYSRFLAGLADGTKTIDDADDAIKSLDRSHAFHQSTLEGTNKKVALNDATRARATAGRAVAANQLNLLTAALNANSLAVAQNTAASAASAFGALKFFTGFSLLSDAISGYSKDLDKNDKKSKTTKTTFKGLRVAAFATGASVRALGSALFGLLGPLGLLISFGPAIFDFFKNKFFPEDETDKKFDTILKMTEKVKDADDQFTRTSLDGANKRVAGAKAGLGAQAEIIGMLDKTLSLERDLGRTQAEEASKNLQAQGAQRDAILESMAANKAQQQTLAFLNPEAGKLRGEFRELEMQLKRVDKQMKATSASLVIGLQNASGEGPKFAEAVENALQGIKDSPVIGQFMSPAIANMEELIESFRNDEMSADELAAEFRRLANEADAGTQFVNNFGASVQGLAQQQNALKAKVAGPFDAITNSAKGIVKELDAVTEGADGVSESLKADILEKYKDQLEAIFGAGGGTEENIRTFTANLEEQNELLKTFPGQLELSKQKLKVLNQVAGDSPAAFIAANKELKKQNDLRKQALEAEAKIIEAANMTKDGVSEQGKIMAANVRLKISAIEAEEQLNTETQQALQLNKLIIEQLQDSLKIRQDTAKEVSKGIKLTEDSIRLQQRADILANRGATSPFQGAFNELEVAEKTKDAKIEAAELEHSLRMEAITLDMALERMKLEERRQRLRDAKKLDPATDQSITRQFALLDELEGRQRENSANTLKNLKERLNLESKEGRREFAKNVAGSSTGLQGLADLQNLTTATDADGNKTQSGLGLFMDEATAREKVEFFKGITSEYVETLKTLGPDGEFVAALTQGTFALTDGILAGAEAFETAEGKAEKFGAVAQAVGNAIGAVNQMMQAGYQRNIQKIDEQIAAEKKRDGKSAASVARIQQMEKKKEQQQRKAFETNKKMLMAQTVANTAAGIMRAIAEGGIAGIVIGSIIAAMGAAQLAIIASQTFDGGSSSAPAGPSKISAGQRRNSVDMAKSQGARGELAYFRGERGTGGPENFRGAFAGYRTRAEGGNTGFMVGEQGPELFMPDRPGRIIPNDDLGTATNTNVSFNINAVDSEGVEDLLVRQRGNIIGMIREAANSYGEDFVESVDTSILTPTTGAGASRY